MATEVTSIESDTLQDPSKCWKLAREFMRMSIYRHPGDALGYQWKLETAETGIEEFATREEAVLRLLEVCGVKSD